MRKAAIIIDALAMSLESALATIQFCSGDRSTGAVLLLLFLIMFLMLIANVASIVEDSHN